LILVKKKKWVETRGGIREKSSFIEKLGSRELITNQKGGGKGNCYTGCQDGMQSSRKKKETLIHWGNAK